MEFAINDQYERSIKMIPSLMEACLSIKEKHADATKTSGENFNVFQILKLGAKEVRLHSTFLAELLNVHGSHSMGDMFLSILINRLRSSDKDALKKLSKFDSGRSAVDVEYHLGPTNVVGN